MVEYREEIVWNEIKTRELDEEEREYYKENGIEPEYMFDCKMPEDGQEVLVATRWGVDKDICCDDGYYGNGLEGRGDWDGVYAWAEMPKYKGGQNES